MKKEMLINVRQPEETRIGVIEDGVLQELYVERNSLDNYVGNIYRGKVVNLEPIVRNDFNTRKDKIGALGWNNRYKADGWALDVRFGSLAQAVADLRAQGLGNVLARPGPPLGKTARTLAETAFERDERFEIVTLTGWNRSPT